ncbi:MAG TPA: zinc-ribbon domain-containing protein [Dehalococcoidia bacterium]|nr:zinc-ribbon domain-containing protein [Dehalococcoidia bacterium]
MTPRPQSAHSFRITERALDALCRDCGRPLAAHPVGRAAVRCPECFDGFLRERDFEFLSSHAELGVASRRIIAETALRALVMESPPHRKVLAMHIMEQYALAASDLIGLYYSVKQRGREPLMSAFLGFKLDRPAAAAFFREMATTPGPELLASLGLPDVDAIAVRCPSLSKSDVRDLRKALVQMLGDFERMGEMGEPAVMQLAQFIDDDRGGMAIIKRSDWLDNLGLRPDQVAAIAIDGRRRTVNVTAISVDEKRLQNVITAIDAMTNAASNLIYGVLTMEQEKRRGRSATGRTTGTR